MGTGESETFGALLRRLRTEASLTQEELSAVTGLSVRAISSMEAGRTVKPYRRSVELLSAAFGLSEQASATLLLAARQGSAVLAAQEPPDQAVRPAQLPSDIAEFTGRAEQVRWLTERLTGSGDQRPVTIAGITGAGGLGKSALAIHVAHRLSEQFPDGQLFVELQGSGDQPVSASEALARLLRYLGVADSAIPADPAERAAEFRTRMSGLRMLVVLDDARDAAHVRPLLPGSPSSAVLVTSRGWLADLEGGRVLVLDSLARADARALFISLCGAERVAAEPEAADSVLGACGGLPLAIRIAAARLVSRPAWDIGLLASRLGDELYRLEELEIGDLAVRATFQISYATLATAKNACAGSAFRLLGLWPGPDISLQAAAALLGLEVDSAQRAIERLVDVHLLEARASQRYRFHDLIRVFAAERAMRDEPAASREAAALRILSWYSRSADRALSVLEVLPSHDGERLPVAPAIQPLIFAGHDDAATWADVERENMVSAVLLAARLGQHAICAELADVTWRCFLRSPWDGWLGVLDVGIASAETIDDAMMAGWLRNHLGVALMFRGAHVQALAEFDEAVRQGLAAGDQLCAASAIGNSAIAYKELKRYDEAIVYFERSLELNHDLMRRGRQLMNLGMIHAEVGRLPDAANCMEEGLGLLDEAGDHWGDSLAGALLADVYRRLGRHDEAIKSAERALELSLRQHNEYQQSAAWHALGLTLADTGRLERARSCLAKAYDLADRLGVPDAKQIAAALDELESSQFSGLSVPHARKVCR